MIKRALEEWRRQRNSANNSNAVPPPPASSQTERDRRSAELEQKVALQQQQLAQLMDAVKSKDEQLAKYEKWYKTLKAGAKAKQRSQAAGSSSSSSAAGMNGSSLDGFSAAPVPKDSFTSSSSFHGYSSSMSSASSASAGSRSSMSSALESDGGRPPAHPTRRAL